MEKNLEMKKKREFKIKENSFQIGIKEH